MEKLCEECNKKDTEDWREIKMVDNKNEIKKSLHFCSKICTYRWIAEHPEAIWGETDFPLRPLTNEEKEQSLISIVIGEIGKKEICYACSNIAYDCCSRCEKKICNKHAIGFMMDIQLLTSLNYCEGCAILWNNLRMTIIKYYKEKGSG